MLHFVVGNDEVTFNFFSSTAPQLTRDGVGAAVLTGHNSKALGEEHLLFQYFVH